MFLRVACLMMVATSVAAAAAQERATINGTNVFVIEGNLQYGVAPPTEAPNLASVMATVRLIDKTTLTSGQLDNSTVLFTDHSSEGVHGVVLTELREALGVGPSDSPLFQAVTLTGALTAGSVSVPSGTITVAELGTGVVRSVAGVLTGTATTSHLAEGSNLYFTDARSRLSLTSGAGILFDNATGTISNIGVTSLAGTANQVSVSGATGAVTLSLPQNIHTAATPTFGGLTIGTLGGVLKASSGDVAGSATTSDLTEGSNLYYTDSRARLSLTAGTGITYTAASGTITNAGVTSAIGTANQVNVSGATGGVTFSLPQSIHTGATPTFAGGTFNGNTTVTGTLTVGGVLDTNLTAGRVPFLATGGVLTDSPLMTFTSGDGSLNLSGTVSGGYLAASNGAYIGGFVNVSMLETDGVGVIITATNSFVPFGGERIGLYVNQSQTDTYNEVLSPMELVRTASFHPPTIAGDGAGVTVTNAATIYIERPPVKSTGATIVNTHGMLIASGAVSTASNSYGLSVNAATGATNNYAAQFIGGNVGIGTAAPAAMLQITQATEQFRSGYDASNYWNATTGSTGITTYNAVGASSAFVFSDPTTITGTLAVNGNVTGTGVGAFNTLTAAASATITGTLANNGNFTTTGNAAISGNITGSGNLLITGTNNLPMAAQIVSIEFTTAVTTGTGKAYMVVTPAMNGKSVNYVNITTLATGTTGTTGVQLVRVRGGTPANVLSTIASIDSAETSSATAATAYVIDTGNDDLQTGDILRVDVSNVTTSAPTGLIFSLEAQ